jgi:nucleoside-diphosphate kinase
MTINGGHMEQQTLVLLKPDAVKRNLVNEIMNRLGNKFKVIAHKRFIMTKELAEEHYAHLKHLDNFRTIIDFMVSGEMVALIYTGADVIAEVRNMIGSTFNAKNGTIRGDYGANKHENLIHASDSIESANTEIKRFF